MSPGDAPRPGGPRSPSAAGRCSVCGTAHDPGACPGPGGVRVGAVLEGKYELVRLMGQGGMGEVYEGRHRVIGRRVAVKFLHGEYARNADVVARFENEARAAGGCEHENIAGVYDIGALADATRYLVMEFLDGEDVEKLLQREAPLPVARAASIVIQACRALDAVHRRGIVHRDLKPSNLFLTQRADKTDLVKVIDFGIAKLKTADARPGTRTGAAIGTAHYMSPEQARGERSIDARSDVYSLGVILYELLSGKRPHEGDSVLQILHKVMTQAPVALRTARPGLPEPLYAIVERAMAPQAAHRYGAAADFGDALLPFAGRPVPSIRSQTAGAPAPSIDIDETHASPSSTAGGAAPMAAPGAHSSTAGGAALVAGRAPGRARAAASTPAGPSFVGVARTEPNALGAGGRGPTSRIQGPRLAALLLAGGGALAGLGVFVLRSSAARSGAAGGISAPAVAPAIASGGSAAGFAASPAAAAAAIGAGAAISSTGDASTLASARPEPAALPPSPPEAPSTAENRSGRLAPSSGRPEGSLPILRTPAASPPAAATPPGVSRPSGNARPPIGSSPGGLPRPAVAPATPATAQAAIPASIPSPSPPPSPTDRGDNPF